MPKSYSQYKYQDLATLGLTVSREAFMVNFKSVEPSDFLKKTIEINSEMTLNTEKAKSEFLIAPVLYEIARENADKVSFFSGHNLDVDKNLGLKGFCDFLYTRVPKSVFVSEPIFCVAEAKNENLEKGTAQCIAEMYAARIFNERQKKPIDIVYGCVTTGLQWQFLKLEGSHVLQDKTIYTLTDLSKILGILQFIVEQ